MSANSARMKLMKIMSNMRTRKRKPAKEAAAKKTTWNIVRGDQVQVVGHHKEHGKQGRILAVLRKVDRVIVEGLNMGTKRIKGDKDRGIRGRTVQQERSMPYSKVNLVDPVTKKPTRIYRKVLEDGTSVRVAKKSGAIIPRPDLLTYRKTPRNSLITESDTVDEDVWETTYVLPPLLKQEVEEMVMDKED